MCVSYRAIGTRVLIQLVPTRTLQKADSGGATPLPSGQPQKSALGRATDEITILPRPQSYDCSAGVQPVAGAAGSAVRASVYRPGLRVQRLQPADDKIARHFAIGTDGLEADRTGLDLLHRDLL